MYEHSLSMYERIEKTEFHNVFIIIPTVTVFKPFLLSLCHIKVMLFSQKS